MSIETKEIHPHKDETYRVGVDDSCLVVETGKAKIWLSKSMVVWIKLWGERILEKGLGVMEADQSDKV